jgi:hypothetical protein
MNLEELTQREIQAFEAFKEKHVQLHPLPEPPSVRGLGWQFYALVMTSLAAVVLAALRTAFQFYRAAQLGGNDTLALVEAAAVIFAIEGGIVIYSAIRSVSNKRISTRMLGWGIFFMVAISTVAGLGQSLNLVENLDPQFKIIFDYVLSFVIGIGASALAWIGGEVLGGQIALAASRSEKDHERYQQELENYNDSMLRSWNSSPERKIARGELTDHVRSVFGDRTNSAEQRAKSNLKNAGSNEQRNRILAYIEEVFSQDEIVPGPTEIAANLGVSKGYAHQVLQEWRNGN